MCLISFCRWCGSFIGCSRIAEDVTVLLWSFLHEKKKVLALCTFMLLLCWNTGCRSQTVVGEEGILICFILGPREGSAAHGVPLQQRVGIGEACG